MSTLALQPSLVTSRLAPMVAGKCARCGAAAVRGKLRCGCRDRGIQVTPLVFSTNATLKQKQEYYEYSARPYRMKEAPVLSQELVQALKRERLDKTYRFLWGGVVLVREEPNSVSFVVARGDREACHDVQGTFMPKYIFARATQARGYCYLNSLNQKVAVTREEFIPSGHLSRVDYRYVDFGMLRWFLEQRTGGQALLDARVYDPKEVVPESEWVALSPFAPMQTKAGLYYEPGLEMIEVLKQREYENRNADLNKIAAETMQRTAKARLEAERATDQAGKKDFDQLYEDVRRRVEKNATYFN